MKVKKLRYRLYRYRRGTGDIFFDVYHRVFPCIWVQVRNYGRVTFWSRDEAMEAIKSDARTQRFRKFELEVSEDIIL